MLQEREFERVGESRTIRVDTRVIAATNQSLEDEIEAGRFRDDLYYRLNVVPIYLPPLRERREDIAALVRFFLERYSEENRRDAPELPPAVLNVLLEYDWPGNVRELENYIERAVVLSQGQELTPELLVPLASGAAPAAAGRPRRNDDLDALIQQPGAHRHSDAAPEEASCTTSIVGGVERELIEQVLQHVRQRAGQGGRPAGHQPQHAAQEAQRVQSARRECAQRS